MAREAEAMQQKIQNLQNMLKEINKYLQTPPQKPAEIVAKILEEKARITLQIRDLSAMAQAKAADAEKAGKSAQGMNLEPYKLEKTKETGHGEGAQNDPLERRADIEEIFEEMEIEAEIDARVKKILLSASDIFIDNLVSYGCMAARNRNAEELAPEDILFALRIEKKMEMYNVFTNKKQREPDKEHVKRVQMVKREQRKPGNR